jgi:hypothetical protein
MQSMNMCPHACAPAQYPCAALAPDLCEDSDGSKFIRDSIRLLGRVQSDTLLFQHLNFTPNDRGVMMQSRPTAAELSEAFVLCDIRPLPDSSSVSLRIAVSRRIMSQHDYDHAAYLGAAASWSDADQRAVKRARGRVPRIQDDFRIVPIPTDVTTDTLFRRGLFVVAAGANNPFCTPISSDLLPLHPTPVA